MKAIRSTSKSVWPFLLRSEVTDLEYGLKPVGKFPRKTRIAIMDVAANDVEILDCEIFVAENFLHFELIAKKFMHEIQEILE